MTKRRTTLEKPRGQGEICLPNGRRLKVHYALVVLKVVDDMATTANLKAQHEVKGTIEVIRPHDTIALGGQKFTLKLDDERTLEASAVGGDAHAWMWTIVGDSPIGPKVA